MEEVESESLEPVHEATVAGESITIQTVDSGEKVKHRSLASTPVILLLRSKNMTYERRVSANTAAWVAERGIRGAESFKIVLDTQGKESLSAVSSQEEETAVGDDSGVALEAESGNPQAGGDGDRIGQRDRQGYGKLLAAGLGALLLTLLKVELPDPVPCR